MGNCRDHRPGPHPFVAYQNRQKRLKSEVLLCWEKVHDKVHAASA